MAAFETTTSTANLRISAGRSPCHRRGPGRLSMEEKEGQQQR